jgi:hypothetical protein
VSLYDILHHSSKDQELGGGFTVFYKFSLRGFKPLTN